MAGMGPGACDADCSQFSCVLAPPSSGWCWASHGPKPEMSWPVSRPAAWKAEMPATVSGSCRVARGGCCPTPISRWVLRTFCAGESGLRSCEAFGFLRESLFGDSPFLTPACPEPWTGPVWESAPDGRPSGGWQGNPKVSARGPWIGGPTCGPSPEGVGSASFLIPSPGGVGIPLCAGPGPGMRLPSGTR